MRPTWLFDISPGLIPKRESPSRVSIRGPFANVKYSRALAGACFFFHLSFFFGTYIGRRLPRVGNVKSNEYRSKVSELRFELQRKTPVARRPYRKNATAER